MLTMLAIKLTHHEIWSRNKDMQGLLVTRLQ